MPTKQTHLLNDDPTAEDEFGAHTRVATLVAEEITNSNEGRSIAVVGDWGSGKSTVIKLIEKQLADLKLLKEKKVDARVFNYDAWSHQGDPLRRSFLDDLINFLKQQQLLTDLQAKEAAERVWNRQEMTTTTVEPIARKHTLFLLLSLALVPLGMKILEIPSGQSTSILCALTSGRNLIALSLIIAPLPLIGLFGLINLFGPQTFRRYLFGISENDSEFSVLSFFFQKTQGTRERKLIKTPADSIIEFKNIFNDLLDMACGTRADLRFVIIIDNIDRIPADHAKDFWSTMQTFFADTGGLMKPRARKYWLVAPFSLVALSFIFRDMAEGGTGKDAESRAKAYVDKTFGIALNVPPPILANWRKYLLAQLQKAFSEHDEKELVTVRDLYGMSVQQTMAVTPRGLKLFVNGLAILYRQRGEDFSLPIMAAFLIHRDEIRENGMVENILSIQEQRILEQGNWRGLFAALYYGVGSQEGNQILLQDPIQNAIVSVNAEQLKQLEDQPGFEDVLSIVVRSLLEAGKNGLQLAGIAATLGGLKAADGPGLFGLWRQLRQRVSTTSDWGKFLTPAAAGLKAIFNYTSPPERRAIVDETAKSLSKCEVGEPDENLTSPSKVVENWLQAALTTVEEGLPNPPDITIPGSARFRLEALNQLAEVEISDLVKTSIKLPNASEIENMIVSQFQAGVSLRRPEKFVGLIAETMKLKIGWPTIVQAAAVRLRTDKVTPPEIHSLITIIVSAATLAADKSAMNALKGLSTEGVLSNLLAVNAINQDARAAIITATILANPKFDRPQQVGQSPEGDKLYSQQIGAPKFDFAQVQPLARFIGATKVIESIYKIGAQNPNVARICAALVSLVSTETPDLDISPKLIIEQKQFLESHAEFIGTSEFLLRLRNREEILNLLSAEEFQIELCRFYRVGLEVSDHVENDRYVSFLEQGVQSLLEADWDKALNSTVGPHFDLVYLCGDIRNRNSSFDLSFAARDAIFEQIRKVGRGTIPISSVLRDNLNRLLDLIRGGLRQSLCFDVVDDLIAAADSATSRRTIDFFGDKLTGEAVSTQAPDRVVRRIFNPILSEPDEGSIAWISRILHSDPTILKATDPETQVEFSLRLRNSFETTSDKPAQNEAIKIIATDLRIDISTVDEAGAEKEQKSSDEQE